MAPGTVGVTMPWAVVAVVASGVSVPSGVPVASVTSVVDGVPVVVPLGVGVSAVWVDPGGVSTQYPSLIRSNSSSNSGSTARVVDPGTRVVPVSVLMSS